MIYRDGMFSDMDDIHPLAGTEREPGWTIQSETDALEDLQNRHDALMRAIFAEKGVDNGCKFILDAYDRS